MDDFSEEGSIDRGVGRDLSEYDIEKEVSEDHQDVLSLFKREKVRLKNSIMFIPGRISLTFDLWTSIATEGYLCLTVHFVDTNWSLQKRVLNFCFMPPPHSGVALCEKIYTLLCEWGIESKLFSMTLDNASTNNVFVHYSKHNLL